MKSLTALLLLVAGESQGSDAFIRYNVNAVPPYPQLKGLTLGVQTKPDVLSFKYEFGFIHDTRTEKYMALGQIGVGVEPQFGPVYVHFFQSVGAVSGEDAYLSGYFQFFEDVGVGFKGTNGTAIGFGYKHISNAGISLPNLGKDMLNIQVRFPL